MDLHARQRYDTAGARHMRRGERAMPREERLVQRADVPTSGVFVGRQSEMGLLRSAFAEAITGSGRCVMLSGEPGIGKTRTCQEIVRMPGPRAPWHCVAAALS